MMTKCATSLSIYPSGQRFLGNIINIGTKFINGLIGKFRRPQPPYRPKPPSIPQPPFRPQPPYRPQPPFRPQPPSTPQPPFRPNPPFRPQPPIGRPQFCPLIHPPPPECVEPTTSRWPPPPPTHKPSPTTKHICIGGAVQASCHFVCRSKFGFRKLCHE